MYTVEAGLACVPMNMHGRVPCSQDSDLLCAGMHPNNELTASQSPQCFGSAQKVQLMTTRSGEVVEVCATAWQPGVVTALFNSTPLHVLEW